MGGRGDAQTPPERGRGTSEVGGGARASSTAFDPHVPLHHPADGPPPPLGEDLRRDFPGLTLGWHYPDNAATAQKTHAVIYAMVHAMGRDYAKNGKAHD